MLSFGQAAVSTGAARSWLRAVRAGTANTKSSADSPRAAWPTCSWRAQRGPSGFETLAVVKRIRPHLAANPEFVRMFLDEARLAAQLRHPNVVSVYDAGQERGEYFFVMEYVHGARSARAPRRRRGARPRASASTRRSRSSPACAPGCTTRTSEPAPTGAAARHRPSRHLAVERARQLRRRRQARGLRHRQGDAAGAGRAGHEHAARQAQLHVARAVPRAAARSALPICTLCRWCSTS